MCLSAAKKIRMMLAMRGMTLADLSRLLGKTPATISNKMKRDNFCEKDLKEIADVLDFDYESVFTDRETGRTI